MLSVVPVDKVLSGVEISGPGTEVELFRHFSGCQNSTERFFSTSLRVARESVSACRVEIGGWESGTRYCTRVTEQFLALCLVKQAIEGCLMFPRYEGTESSPASRTAGRDGRRACGSFSRGSRAFRFAPLD